MAAKGRRRLQTRGRPRGLTGVFLLLGAAVCFADVARVTFCGLVAAPVRGVNTLCRAASLKVDGCVEPLGSYVLVKSAEAEEETKGGILLPKSEKPRAGEVVAVGPGEASKTGVVKTLSVNVGEKVVYSRYGGSETIECGGTDHVLVRESDIMLRFEGQDPSLEKISMPRGKVLVKLLAKEEETAGGFFLSNGAAVQTTTAGEVVSVGAGLIAANGEELAPGIQVGDMVRFRYGDEVDMDIGDDKFSVVSMSNCIAKWA
eukprot:TRINITY_DN17114_c0_g1_i1.p1 TRINITY_DN17114_c0_g1~~TRINITY_DN17114_c0_g1_i1.p1  ORF type:complete len:266 (+),score=62.21 TRINITY_DN17114_c0_g1_i1:24-800(+)